MSMRSRFLETSLVRICCLCCLALACGRSSRHDMVATMQGAGAAGKLGGAGSGGGVNAGGRSGAGGSTTGGAAGSSEEPELSFVALDGTPLYTRVARLTLSQWEHAVTDILRFPAPRDLSKNFVRPRSGLTDFDNNEKLLFVDATNILDFESGAEAAAQLATESAEALAALYDGTDVADFVRTLGRRAFRRPLSDAEQRTYVAMFARGEELYGVGFAHGAALVIRAMLQSPHFLYRGELGPAGEALNAYELASKLSFWLLDTTPSDALLDAAAAGELDSEEGLEAAARAMLDAPAAVEVMRDFHRQLLAMDRYASLDKSGVPEFDAAVLPELDAVSNAFLDRVFKADLGLREILTSKQGYVGAGLAPLYGMSAPASGLELRDLGPSRSGYFMQVPFLMLWADGARSDPIHRGARLERMLCGPLPASNHPPQTIAAELEGRTMRAYVTALTADCGGSCHVMIDPLGFALENFDGLGRERADDGGRPVSTASSYPFAEGAQEFGDGTDLVGIMAESGAAHTCYSKNVTSYALGRDMAPDDRQLLEGLGQVSLSHSLRELVLALVRDAAFRSRTEVAP
jgi:hypothetical protein